MNKARLIGGAALLVAAWAAQAAPPIATTTPPELIGARQSGMDMSVIVLGAMKGTLERGDAVKTQTFAARGLAKWAGALPTLFPNSTRNLAGNRAKPEVWLSKPDFTAKAAAFAAAANSLVSAAQADDKVAFAAALATTAGTCKACHDTFQLPPPPRPAG
ncbi:MAG TPA: cytochrome c [Novosphingobium sp.]|nr:cytochrome c [Novosphingobium sp.]